MINKGMPIEERAEEYLLRKRYNNSAVKSAFIDGFKEAIELAAAWILEHTDDYGAMYGADKEMPKDIIDGLFPLSE